MSRIKRFLTDENEQTTIEWGVLSIMIAMGLVVIGLAFQNDFIDIINTFGQRILVAISSP